MPVRFRWVLVTVGLLAILVTLTAGLWNDAAVSPTESAVAVCADCGLAPDEVRAMIHNIASGSLGREQAIDLWRKTYSGPADEGCLPCAEAIVDVAMETRR